MSSTPSQPNPTTKEAQMIEHEGREFITAGAYADAITFLSTRWKAFETASKNTNIPESERPQILREKSTGHQHQQQAGNTSNTGNVTTGTGNKQQSSGTSTPTSKGSPWSGGRRH